MNLLLALLVILVLLFPACSRNAAQPTAGSPAGEDAPAVLAQHEGGEQQPHGKFLVRIVPEKPMATEDLVAVHDASGTVAYQWLRNDQPVAGATGDRLAQGHFAKGDTVSVVVTAEGRQERASVMINDSSPRVVSVSLGPKYITTGVDITADAVGDDPDGDVIQFHYQWSINGQEQLEDEPVLKGDSFKRGDTISVVVTPFAADGEGQSFASAPIVIPNAPPRITSTPPREYRNGVYAYRVTAVDPDGDVLAYSLAAAPAGMNINGGSGLISWPITEESVGTHTVEIVAQDSSGAKVVQKYSLTIEIPEGEEQ